MRTGYTKLILPVLLLLLALSSCGGTNNVGVVGSDDINDDGRQGSGVTLDNFEVIRYNSDGFPDAGLNNTLSLKLEPAGGETALVISVAELSHSRTVALDVRYDSRLVNPARVEFHGLLGEPAQVISASFLNQVPGVASVGETTVGDFVPAGFSGEFATLYFAGGASRAASAAGDVHQYENGIDDQDIPTVTASTKIPNYDVVADSLAQTINIDWYGAWHRADGDQNSEVNIADLTPLGIVFGQATETNFAAIRGDYNRDGLVTINDLTPIGFHFQERTTLYTTAFSDNTAGAPQTTGPDVAWGTGTAAPGWPNTGVVAGELNTVFTTWGVDVTAGSTPSYTTVSGLDVSGPGGSADGFVTLHVTPANPTSTGDAVGVTASIEVPVSGVVGQDDQLFITGFDVQLEGVTGGTGTNGDIFALGGSGSAVANAPISFSVNSISGTFNAAAFSSDNLPTGMEQTDFDAALEAVQESLSWGIDHEGAAGFRRVDTWAIFDGTTDNPVIGDPGAGVIFPDDDPESDASNQEGVLSLNLPATTGDGFPAPEGLDIKVIADVSGTIDVDVTEDLTPAEITFYGSDPQAEITSLTLGEDNTVFVRIQWDDTPENTPIEDLSVSQLEMYRMIDDPSNPGRLIPALDANSPLVFTFNNQSLGPNEFDVRFDNQGMQWHAAAVIPALRITAGAQYAFRYHNGLAWTSINRPSQMLATEDPPSNDQELVTAPELVNNNHDYMQLFYKDPAVRRSGRRNPDILNGTFLFPDGEPAYNDILKINGDEFLLDINGPQIFPTLVVKEVAFEDRNDPDQISGPDDPDAAPGVFIVEYGANRFVVDVQALSFQGQLGDPPKYYVYRLYGQAGQIVGWGRFEVQQIAFELNDIQGINWGINVWDREELEIANRDYQGKNIASRATVETDTPDVIWVEFAGGYYYDWDQEEDNINPYLILDQTDGAEDAFNLALRIAGIDPNGSVMAIHPLTNDDFFVPGNPLSGLLRAGKIYDVKLESPKDTGSSTGDWDFPTQLIVTN